MPAPPPLWSDAFLETEIREQPDYQALLDDSAEFDKFVEAARRIVGEVRAISSPDEQLTIERAITPLLAALGWPTPLPKRNLTSRDEIDLALYADEAQRELSLGTSERDQVLNADGIVECKEWGRPLDGSGSGARPGETAAQQLQRYLLIAGTDSAESLRWGILTNGAQWRIYSYRARPRDRTWEIDLADLLVSQDLFNQALTDETRDQLRIAWLLFRRDSWIAAEGERESLLDRLLNEGRRSDQQVADNLSDAIFKQVYPDLIAAFWRRSPEASANDVARAALYFLYRLLFLSYAEDRGLLPVESESYAPVSLRRAVRDRVGNGHQYPQRSTTLWDAIETLRDMVDQGDEQLGVPAYDGRLFAPIHRLLDEIKVPDAELAAIIAPLSHDQGRYISYRLLSVQQLGSIYEKLLEFTPQRDPAGAVDTVLQPYARKDSGSYYTPQELVDLIVEQTLTPLVEERIAAFRNDPSEANDPALALLNLKILDPAMGSGHFLITAIDWLAERIMELLSEKWEHDPDYESPLRAELAQIRQDLTREPEGLTNNPAVEQIERNRALLARADPPEDRALVRRMVLKRCIYGVDKNPLAVELARVAFWLHTFTPPLPLPYLSHRIRAGDSLLGISVERAAQYVDEWGRYYTADGLRSEPRDLIESTDALERQLTESLDLTLPVIDARGRDHDKIEVASIRSRHALNLIAGFRWLSAGLSKGERERFHEPLRDALSGHTGRAVAILYNGENREGLTPSTPAFQEIRGQIRTLTERERPFHWEIEFPQVMGGGGFDAVITNPPWDRIEQQEKEWFAARGSEIANLEPAARRKAAIAEGIANGDPLCVQYEEARAQAAAMRLVCRESGDYPLLSGGRTNFYSLFVERALSLINPNGIAGILTPSGIYSDQTASRFFREMSTNGRVGGIYDFENRRTFDPSAQTPTWFPDVDTRFKFCATIIAGAERRFGEAKCGFYLHGKADLAKSDRVFPLTPDDFARINPNTGAAPTLRSRADAELMRRIYREHPVLVDRSSGDEAKAYPIRFTQGLFNMTSDSALFRTAEQLEAEGCYRVAGHRYRRGDAEWAPLYQGRMIHHFDHRANAVGFNPKSQDNPYFSIEVSDTEKQDAAFFPSVQYWVSVEEIVPLLPLSQRWVIAFRDITNSTNERTMIATIAPWSAFGNQTPLLLPAPTLDAGDAALLTANLSSLALDFVAKRKVQGTHMNWFILEQLPVVAPADYDRTFGETTARELVRDHALRLSYTAHDLAPFARDLGYEGEPYTWDPAERRQLRARLDALYFHLYGLDEDDTAYVLDQFCVLKRNERKADNRYLTKELVLGHYAALAAGDSTSEITTKR